MEAKNPGASSEGTAKANAVSCEIRDSGFQVVGKVFTELLLGIDISPATGAFRGKVLDRESGNTKVISIVCWEF